MTSADLNNKRARKEAKRQVKRNTLRHEKLYNLKGRKARALKEKAMDVINKNPFLLAQFNAIQETKKKEVVAEKTTTGSL